MGNDHLRVIAHELLNGLRSTGVRGLATPGVGAGANADSGQTHFTKTRLSAGPSGRRRADRPATGRGALGKVGRMTAKAFEIQVQDDHLARIAQTRKPVLALAELIWNAVDADATRIDVTLINNDLDGLEAIEVTDNGHGIPYAQAEDLFSRLGGSWKQSRTHSNEENRILHGKEGRGRFRAFSLGRVVEWDVRAADPSGALQRYRISMIADRLRRRASRWRLNLPMASTALLASHSNGRIAPSGPGSEWTRYRFSAMPRSWTRNCESTSRLRWRRNETGPPERNPRGILWACSVQGSKAAPPTTYPQSPRCQGRP